MKKYAPALIATALLVVAAPVSHASKNKTPKDFVPPLVFQAAGPTAESIQSALDEFRAALGEPNNAGNPGPLASGRREINWDGGGGVDATTAPVTPFNVFLDSRGSQFTTPGTGLTQAPPSGGPDGGLATLAGNPNYGTAFAAFSPMRLFAPIGSNITDAFFFVPGSGGGVPATVTGFGAVFSDVDQPDGSGPGKKKGNRKASTLVQFFDAEGDLLFSSFVPASPGEATFSFFGAVFDEAVVGSVRITTGDVALGPDDRGPKRDVVVMDDFLYGEPQAID